MYSLMSGENRIEFITIDWLLDEMVESVWHTSKPYKYAVTEAEW